MGLYICSVYDYLLFHCLAELFCVVVAISIFILMWNARRYDIGDFPIFIGMTFLYVAAFDLIHTLAYKDMGVFPDESGNLATQFWITGRYVLALSLVTAPMLFKRLVNRKLLFGFQAFFSIVLFLLVVTGNFPECFNPASGLTRFKIASEHAICILLIVSILLFRRLRADVQPEMMKSLMTALALTIVSEIMFNQYVGVYDKANLVGHFLKIMAYYFVYRAVVVAGLMRPYDLLFKRLKSAEETQRTLLNAITESVFLFERDGTILIANETLAARLGKKVEEVIGANIFDLLPAELANARRLRVEESVLTGKVVEFEDRQQGRYIHNRIYPLFDGQGGVANVVVYGMDITERKNAEETMEAMAKFPGENPNPVLRLSLDGVVLYANNAAAPLLNLWGCKAGLSLPDPVCESILGSLSNGKKRVLETACDDTVFSLTITPIVDACYVNVYGMDITERKRAELALRQAHDDLEKRVRERTAELVTINEELEAEVSERKKAQISLMKWGQVFEHADWGVVIGSADGKTLELMNPAYAAMHGYTPEELTGRPISDVFAPGTGEELPDKTRRIHEQGQCTFESLHMRKDGSVFPVLVNASAVRDEHGRVLFRVVNVQNISMLKAAEEERSRLITAIESIDDAIAITDTDGTIRYVNPAYETMTGFRPDEVTGEKLRIMSREFNDEATYMGLWNNLSLGMAWRGRVKSLRKDGVSLIEDCSIFPVRDNAGAIINFIAVKRDVTAKERLESIADAVNSMNNIGYIFSGIRHELGNPINSMKTALNVLSINLDRYTPEEVKRYLARIQEELEKIEYLLKSLKSFSMFENLDIHPLEVAPFMDKLLVLVKGDFSKRGVKISLRIASPFLRCHADPRALQQVLLNILTNAADACEEGREGKIVMSVFSVYDTIMIRIVDNGRGMVPEQINSMFKPFYTTKPGGTGLGLMLVKKMLSRMNGAIEITSDAGQGTTVDIFLPEATK